MSDSPLMNKMDALLKKHRGGGDAPTGNFAAENPAAPEYQAVTETQTAPGKPSSAEGGAPPHAWLPVLTQIIERGTPPAIVAAPRQPAATSPTPTEAEPALAASCEPEPSPHKPEMTAHPETATQAAVADAAISDTMAEQLMSELAPRLSEVMEKQVAAELRKNLDQTVANLLSQLDVNVREIVRDAVTEKLKQPRNPSS